MAHESCVFTAFAGSQELLDPQLLLDPLEKSLQLATILVKLLDYRSRQSHVVVVQQHLLSCRLGIFEWHLGQRSPYWDLYCCQEADRHSSNLLHSIKFKRIIALRIGGHGAAVVFI